MENWPQIYTCKFIEPGIVSYEDSDAGIALIKKETIDSMLPTFIGRPVVIQHQSVTPKNIADHAVGYVVRAFFNPEDGWFYADFLVTSDEAKRLIEDDKYSVSCAYNVLDIVDGGLWHDIRFDGEITKGEFTHLALVQDPRYEESEIKSVPLTMLVNGKVAHNLKNSEGEKMFRIFKKKDEQKEDYSNLVASIDGTEIPVADLVTHYQNSKKDEEKKKENAKEVRMAKDEDVVDIDGKEVSIGDLKASYASSKKNEKEEEEKKDEEKKNDHREGEEAKEQKKNESGEEKKEDEEKKNSSDEKKEDEEEKKENEKGEEKENAKKGEKYFAELSNARGIITDDDSVSSGFSTRQERADNWAAKNKK